MPPTVPVNHSFDLVKTNEKDWSEIHRCIPKTLSTHHRKDQSLIPLSHANICKAFFFVTACFEHSILFKVNGQEFYYCLDPEWEAETSNPKVKTPTKPLQRFGIGYPTTRSEKWEYWHSMKSVSERLVKTSWHHLKRLDQAGSKIIYPKTKNLLLSQSVLSEAASQKKSRETSTHLNNKLKRTRNLSKNTLRSNYELFNCNNFSIRYWSWNYRGCWHQTCPPIVPR